MQESVYKFPQPQKRWYAVSMIDNNERIIWGNVDDLSYGGGARMSLVIVRESDLTDADREALDKATAEGDDAAVLGVLIDVEARLSPDTCLCCKNPSWRNGTE